MLPRTRRLAALLTIVLLLLPVGTGQAATATAPVPPQVLKALAERQETPTPPTYLPAALADPGVKALGGPAGVEAKRQELLAAPKTQPGASPTPPPTHTLIINPDTGGGAPQQPVSTTASAAATSLSARRPVFAPAELEPPVATQQAAFSGYSLQFTTDVFAAGADVSTTATLLANGQPVAGATITLALNGGISFTTGENGTAAVAFTAPDRNDALSVFVTTPDQALREAYLLSLYVVLPNSGAIIIENVTDHLGNPITTFETQIHPDGGGLQGNHSINGRVGVILPAGTGKIEVRAKTSEASYYTYQALTIPGGGRATVHPSFAGHTLVQFAPAVTGIQSQNVSLNLAPAGETFSAWPADLGTSVYMPQGDFHALLLLEGQMERYVLNAAVTVAGTAPITVPLARAKHELSAVVLESSGGTGQFLPPDYIDLRYENTALRIPTRDKFLLLAPGPYFPTIASYTMESGKTPWYYYHLWRESTEPQIATLHENFNLRFGWPVRVEMSTSGSATPGSRMHLNTNLLSFPNDRFQPVRCDPACSTIMGTFQVYGPTGALLKETSIDPQDGLGWYDFPANAVGTYTFKVTYPIGPFGPPVQAQVSFNLAPPPRPRLTLSRDTFARGTAGQVTATLTNNDQPVAGATLQIGPDGKYGIYTTDADGKAAFTFQAPVWSEAIPIGVYGAGFGGTPAYLFSLGDDEAALIVTGATDHLGADLPEMQVTLSTYFPDGGDSLHTSSLYPGYVLGSVRPAGPTHVEISSYRASNNTDIYLYDSVTLAAGERREIKPSGQGAQPLTVIGTVEGSSMTGLIRLHNEAMDGVSRFATRFGSGRPIYVRPGRYSAVFTGNSWPYPLLTGTGFEVAGPSTARLEGNTNSLASVKWNVPNGSGGTISVSPEVAVNNVGLQLSSSRVTPGVGYTLLSYAYDIVGAELWAYYFRVLNPTTVTPAPGGLLDLGMGGPVSIHMSTTDPTIAGRDVAYSLRALTPGGHSLRASRNGQPAAGRLAIRDESGAEVWSTSLSYLDYDSFHITMPQTPGNYTLVLDYPTGPYQGDLHHEQPLEVIPPPPAVPLTLTVSPPLIPPGVSTAVTARVTRGGVPVPGGEVWLDGSYVGTTNSAGEVVTEVLFYGSRAVPAKVHDGDGSATEYLYVLSSGMAAVEVTANDEGGLPLDYYWVAGSSPSEWSSTYSDAGKAALVIPAGFALVEMVKEGAPAYFMRRSLTLPAGDVTKVHFDAQTAVSQEFTVTLDSAPVAGWLSLHPAGSKARAYLDGLMLDSQGRGRAHLTPGSYETLVQAKISPDTGLVAIGPAQEFQGTAVSLQVDSAALGTVQLGATAAGAARPMSLHLSQGPFDFSTGAAKLRATAGTYEPYHLWAQVPQGDGSTWAYNFTPIVYQPISVVPGSDQSVSYDLNVDHGLIRTQGESYGPGDYIGFQMHAVTASFWTVETVGAAQAPWGARALIDYTITDAGGLTVYEHPGAHTGWDYWQTPAEPSQAYTIRGRRNLGALGSVAASATLTLARPVQVLLSRETVPMGQLTAVTFTVSDGFRPIPGAVIRVIGSGVDLVGQTGLKGTVTLGVRPQFSGQMSVQVSGKELLRPYYTSLYSLGPNDGLLDVVAVDREGNMLQWGDYMAVRLTDGLPFGWGSVGQKAVVPAGEYAVYTAGYSLSGDAYYMRSQVSIPALGKATALADGEAALPLPVSVANRPAGSYGPEIVLRDLALPYSDGRRTSLRHDGDSIFVTPGTYEALVVQQSTNLITLLPVPAVTVDGTTALTVDAAAATSRLAIWASVPEGATTESSYVMMRTGGVSTHVPVAATVAAPPGTYTVGNPVLWVQPAPLEAEEWLYLFSGANPVTLTAGTTYSFDLLQSWTHTLKPAATTVSPGGRLKVTADLETQPGLRLEVVLRVSGMGYSEVQGRLLVTGPAGYSTSDSMNSWLEWQAPTLSGTYTFQHVWDLGPLGLRQASATVQVKSLPRILR